MNYPLLNKNNIYEIEKKITPTYTLMNKAGKLSAKYINEKLPKKKILIICGVGGNGGDGFVLAEELKKKYKWQVTISILGDLNKIDGDAKKAFNKLTLKQVKFEDINLNNLGYVVDAIFGIGLSRKIQGKNLNIIKTINTKKIPVIALDIPSGINSDNGEILSLSFNCFLTLSYSSYKIGQHLLPGAKYCGKIVIIDIGIPRSYLQKLNLNIQLNSKDIWFDKIMWPQEDDHKYSRGYTLVIGGPKEMTGASRLAAIAAQRAGSGIVTLASDINSSNIYYQTLSTQIVKCYKNITEFKKIISDKRIDSVIIGPGLGVNSSAKKIVKNILRNCNNIIIDADAISCFEKDFKTLQGLVKYKNVVITPHEGEFNKLFPNLKGSLIEKASYAANKLNSIIVLKSATTIIASPKSKVILNQFGAKWLATAGSGDVLSGIIGALVSNKMETFYAAAYGVWIHSNAAREFGPGLIAEDIPALIPKIYKKIYKNIS